MEKKNIKQKIIIFLFYHSIKFLIASVVTNWNDMHFIDLWHDITTIFVMLKFPIAGVD